MNLRLLHYFVACVDHKTMHAAAEAVHISQPALSKAIHSLEEELSVRLLDRQPRGVVPTPFGETLYRYAKTINSDMRRALAELDAMRGATSGTIEIGLLPSMCASVGAVAARIMAERRGLIIKLHAALPAELSKSLLSGNIDIAITLFPGNTPPFGIDFSPLVVSRPVLAVRHGHPLAAAGAPTLQALCEFPWLIPDFPPSHREVVQNRFLEAGVIPPSTTLGVSSIVFFENLIRETDMITIAPSTFMIGADGRQDRLAALDVDFNFPVEQVGIAWRQASTLLPGTRVVMDMLVEQFKRLNEVENIAA